MIKSVTIVNYMNEKIVIDIFNPSTSGLQIRKIDGLGPVKANITTTPIVTSDGDIYNSARADKRNIVLELGFQMERDLDLPSIEHVRQMTYKYFPLKSQVKINIKTDNRDLYTYGYVESNEPNIFSDDETAQISLICPNSYFTSEVERNEYLDQLKPVFKFPFECLMEIKDKIDIMEPDTEYTVQTITETGNYSDLAFNGNYFFKLYTEKTVYMDMEDQTYDDMSAYTYDQLILMNKI